MQAITSAVIMARMWQHLAPQESPSPSPPLPFPKGIPRMYEAQMQAVAAVSQDAPKFSSAATAGLLAHLNTSAFRQGLDECCPQSGLSERPAHELLRMLREMLYVAELAHNFDGSFETDATIDILGNATEYFPNTWQLRYLQYYGPRFNPSWGFPRSCEGVAEEGIFRLPRFRGPHDEPLTYEAASSRLLYIALNMLRVDVGNPGFGNVTAVFSPRFWRDAVVASPIDTGLFTMFCNETYRHINGSHVPHYTPHIACDSPIAAGVAGSVDHVLLNNLRFWRARGDVLLKYFARTYSVTSNVSLHSDLDTYIEPNILANALYREHGALKLLVGSFSALFGTRRGAALRTWAASRSIVLAWAVGPGAHVGDHQQSSFAGRDRVLDVTVSAPLVNASVPAGAADAFEAWWADVARARDPHTGALAPADVWTLWGRGARTVPASAQLTLPKPRDCADWAVCLGRSHAGECVCMPAPPVLPHVPM